MSTRVSAIVIAFLIVAIGQGLCWAQPTATGPAATMAKTKPWPRVYQKDENTVILYQPQVDSWKDQSQIRFRAALALTTSNNAQPQYGVLAVQGDTFVDRDERKVIITNIDAALRFPGLTDEQAQPLKVLVKELLPHVSYLDVPLENVLAAVDKKPDMPKAEINMNPPPIYYSDIPAILITYIGQPQFQPIKGTDLMFAVNTNWALLLETKSKKYYLLDNESWLTTNDPLKGPWTPTTELPADLSKLPAGENWDEVKKNIPGKPLKVTPRVITSTQPAELIVTQGPPDYSPIQGTSLMYISNPEMPLFYDLVDSQYYYLVAGRWFSAASLSGPWTAASSTLPAEFAKIPPTSPVGYVLASIPNTQEARDAVLLASIPHKATIKINEAKVDVTYDGSPKFVPITGTTMTYAANTPYQVICVNNQYYCCYQGVWFMAGAASGPWAVCTSVPAAIYTIPPSSPLYNVTYVQVYSSTPDTVVVGYTSGYSGEYVAATGVLMFGAGMLTGALIAANNPWYCCSPCYYSYGCAAHYNYAYGGYYRAGGAYYGPHGGAGWGSAYNPATGTWGRAGYAYGPSGAHWGAQAYNPFTNTYAQHTGGSNGYKSWGSSYVQQGSNWAQASHQSDARGSVGEAQTSSGKWAEGAHSNVTNSSLAKASNGDVYAGHDGNVYRKSDGQWQKYSGSGNWSDTSWNKSNAQQYKANDSAAAENNWQNAQKSHSENTSSQDAWKNNYNSSQWKNDWENKSSTSGAENSWKDHDTQSSLNHDSWSRNGSAGGGGEFHGYGGGGGGRRR